MEKSDIELYLSAVASQFKARLEKLHKIGSDQLYETDYFLSEVLFKVAAKGASFPIGVLEKTAIALELLYQAINFGYLAQTSASFSDEILLATDYYYAEAIEQVVKLNEPEIVRLLAKAIADTAADRTLEGFEPKEGKRLFEAAVEIGLFLGACADSAKNNIRESINKFSNSNKRELLNIING